MNGPSTTEQIENYYSGMKGSPDQSHRTVIPTKEEMEKILGHQELEALRKENLWLKNEISILSHQAANLSLEDREAVLRDAQVKPLSTLRKLHHLHSPEPRHLTILSVVITGLISRCEKLEQELIATKNEMISETTHLETLSEMNTLKISIMKLEAERHALVQAMRITASDGKIDPIETT